MNVRFWRATRYPVDEPIRTWVDTQLLWLLDEFGPSVINANVLTPTVEDLGTGVPSDEGGRVRTVVDRLATHVGVDASCLEVEIFEDDDRAARAAIANGVGWSQFRAGDWSRRGGRSVIAVDRAIVELPRALVATVAHELAHERLLGEGRIHPDRADGEQLTDLATVFLGLGIFTANAAREFSATSGGSWRASRLGYLDEATMGYALARFSYLRGETDPPWSRYLDTSPAAFMRQAARLLASAAAATHDG